MSTATERARGRRGASREASREAARERLRGLVTRSVAETVTAMLRDDLDGLREALADRLLHVEEAAETVRRPDLRVLDGDAEPVVVRSASGRIFAPEAELVAAGIVTPRLRVVR